MKVVVGILLAIVVAIGTTKWRLHEEVSEAVDMAVVMMSPFAVVQYEGVSSTMTGELTIDGIRARVKGFNDEIFIERFGIDTPSFWSLMKLGDFDAFSDGDVLPEYFGIIAEGIRVPVDADYLRRIHNDTIEQLGVSDAEEPANLCTGKYGFSPRALAAMSYSDQILSVTAGFRQVGSRFAVEFSSQMVDMFHAEGQFVFAGDMMSAMSQGSSYRPRLSEMLVTYRDDSLNDRVLRYCEKLGLTPDEARQAMIDSFRYFGEQNGIGFDEYVMGPYAEFIDGKSSLVVTATPREPVMLSQIGLYKPSDVPALLNLSAEAR